MQRTNLNIYRLGQVVRLKSEFLGEPAGTEAYVYESYTIGTKRVYPNGVEVLPEAGVSLITIRGVDLGGFSAKEQWEYLEHVRDTNFFYQFTSVTQLARDYRNGAFEGTVWPIVNRSSAHPGYGPASEHYEGAIIEAIFRSHGL